MAKIKRKKYTLKEWPKQDLIIKLGSFELYFQNYYNLISLLNDLATGLLYLIGSILILLNRYTFLSNVLYFLGGFSLFLRPIIKIVQNIFIYKNQGQPVKFRREKRKKDE